MKHFITSFIVLFFLSCSFDPGGLTESASEECGNGVVDSSEECEPGVVPVESCSDYGFSAGVLSCTDSCIINTDGCTNICTGCIPDAVKCEGNSRFICNEVTTGCGEWNLVEECTEPGAICLVQAGVTSCVVSCVSDCDVEGARRCGATGVETCTSFTIEQEQCLMWSSTQECAPDVCETHTTTGEVKCVPDCNQGDKKCSTDNTRILACGYGTDGFTAWIEDVACIINSEQCVLSPTNIPYCQVCEGCTIGDSRCDSGNLSLSNCTGTAGCTWWEPGDTCVSGTMCSQISPAVAQCNSCVSCSVGSSQCITATTLSRCVTSGNGCTSYIGSENCPWGNTCSGGVCNYCSSCSDGQTACASADTEVYSCSDNGSGCFSMQMSDSCTMSEECRSDVWTANDHLCIYTGSGNRCNDPYLVSSLPFNLTGFDFSSLTDNTTFSCTSPIGSSSIYINPGREFFMEVYLNQDDVITFSEYGGMDSIVRILDSCGPTCLISKDTVFSETLTWTVPSDGYYIFVVENYRGDGDPSNMSVSITD